MIGVIDVAIGPSAALALDYLTKVFNRRQLGRRTPAARPAAQSLEPLANALEKRVDKIGAGRKIDDLDINQNVPTSDVNAFNPFVDADFNDYASNGINPASGNYAIKINPNVDEAYLAHELGHVASRHTDIGALVRSLRDNPKLTTALGASLFTLPGLTAALEAGDNDMDTSIALAAAAGLPKLVDEGLATKNGLAIMDMAGRRATMGQRGKLAGAFMTYLTPAIVAGASGNFVGNLVDKDI